MARRPPEPAVNPIRGAVLVIVAVVVGLLLLRNGLDTSETVRSDGSDDTNGATDETTDEGATDDGETDGTDTTEPAARPPSQVSAIVLNASGGVSGAAGSYTTALEGLGYSMLTAGNATASVEATQVLYAAGFEAEAAALAASLTTPTPITPEPLGATPPGDVGNANLVVVLGPDIASEDPPAVASDTTTDDTTADATDTADTDATDAGTGE